MPREEVANKLDEIAGQIDQALGGGEPAPGAQAAEPPQDPPAEPQEPAPGEPEPPAVDPDEAKARELGWLNLDEWTAEGRDPALWAGHKRFLKDGEKRTQTQDLRAELQETKQGISQMLAHFEAMTKQQQTRHKAELQTALEKAKADLDVDAVVNTQKQIDQIEQHEAAQATPQAQPQGEHQVIAAFRAKNPQLDKQSDQFNQAFNTVMESQANERLMEATKGWTLRISDDSLQRILDDSYRATKAMFPEAKTDTPQPRPKRTPPATGNASRGNGQQADPVSSLDADAREMHSFILKKSGKRAAEQFLKLHKENDTDG